MHFLIEDYQKALERLEKADARIAELENELEKYRWHRNCVETPVPPKEAYYLVISFRRSLQIVKYHNDTKMYEPINGERICYYDAKQIKYWLEIPEVDE